MGNADTWAFAFNHTLARGYCGFLCHDGIPVVAFQEHERKKTVDMGNYIGAITNCYLFFQNEFFMVECHGFISIQPRLFR